MGRIKLDMPSHYIYSVMLRVRITDINYGNHLGNDALLSMIHEARVSFLNNMGYTEADVAGAGIIMVDAAIVYKAEAFFGEELTFEITVDNFSRKSCDFFYRVSKDDNLIVAHCKTGILFFDYSLKKPVNVPEDFKNKIKGLES